MQLPGPSISLIVQVALAITCAPAGTESIDFLFGPDCTDSYKEEPESVGCHFPSRGPDGQIRQCQQSRGGLWCPTTADYCSDGRFKWCPGTDSTYGGTDPGKHCRFPFTYKGEQFRYCIRRDTRGENYLWCSTTPGNFSEKWTRCRELSHLMPCQFSRHSSGIERQCIYQSRKWVCQTARGDRRVCDETEATEAGNDPGSPCHFPFKYNGVRHKECLKNTDQGEEFVWCGTTANFDRDHLWTRCKQKTAFRLEGLLLLIVVVASAVLGACALAYLVHCLCEHGKPMCLRLCGSRRARANRSRRRKRRSLCASGSSSSETEPPLPPPTPPSPPDEAKKLPSSGQSALPPLTPTAPPPYEAVAALSMQPVAIATDNRRDLELGPDI